MKRFIQHKLRSNVESLLFGDPVVFQRAVLRDQSVAYGKIEGVPLLHVAAKNNLLGVMHTLVMAGVMIDSLDPYGETGLSVAIKFKRKEAVIFLLEHGAKLDFNGVFNLICSGMPEDVVFLQHLAPFVKPMDLCGVAGVSLLSFAMQYRQVEFSKILFLKRPDLCWAKDDYGNTPLHIAILSRSTALIALLRSHKVTGWDFIKNNSGDTPYNIAEKMGYVDLICPVDDNRKEPFLIEAPAGLDEVSTTSPIQDGEKETDEKKSYLKIFIPRFVGAERELQSPVFNQQRSARLDEVFSPGFSKTSNCLKDDNNALYAVLHDRNTPVSVTGSDDIVLEKRLNMVFSPISVTEQIFSFLDPMQDARPKASGSRY